MNIILGILDFSPYILCALNAIISLKFAIRGDFLMCWYWFAAFNLNLVILLISIARSKGV